MYPQAKAHIESLLNVQKTIEVRCAFYKEIVGG